MSSSYPSQVDATELKEPSVLQASASHEENHSSTCSHSVDKAFEWRIKWKLDLFILPVISSVYFFASMGRSDLANAKIAGLTEELHLTPQDYSNAATIFLVAYVIFQLPGTLLIKKIRAPIQFSGAMIVWGFLTAITVVIKNHGQLLALRFLIGAAEAFVQGGVFYLSFWYEYRELATRGAIFYSMSTVAGAFNGLIAYAIAVDLDGVNGWRAWRWIFLVEGVLPCGFAFVVLALLPASPSKLRWGWKPEEKEYVVQKALRSHNTTEARLDVKKVPAVLLDVHFWLFTLIACGGHFCLGSLSNFLPDIIEGFGYDTVNSQLFTVIVYISAFIGVIFWCRLADITNARGLVLAGSTVGAVVSYAILIGATARNTRFGATCLLAFSIFPNPVLQLSWSAMNFVGYTRRGSALAFFNIISQVFGICGTQAYSDPPYYRKGNAAALGLSVMIIVASLALRWWLSYLNRQKGSQLSSSPTHEMSQQSIEDMGDKHPGFLYST
ncbi:Uu.00g076830.m01.CDS01 [Anthostomella pinea]|uniref:Uu.00g076830.m01.CDS01 n=1 Tax=Anthostomella pinea TaxID=933095 RepID=A0AAI8VX52_9PEZI|nr:Uu.00g076830.m01.CDS01 [Anthostomella pinea]